MRHPYTFLALLIACAHAFAQQVEPGQPMFWMQSEESFSRDNYQYSIKWDSRFALSALNDGSSKFDRQAVSSLDLFRLRGGFQGLKPGEKIDFYVIEESASGSATEKSVPQHNCRTTLSRQGRFMQYTNGEAALFEQRPTLRGVPGSIQYSAQNEATFTRTAQGGYLTYGPRIFPCGWENLQSNLFAFGFSKADRATLGTFVLSENDLRNWQQVSQVKQGEAQVGDTERVQFKATIMGAFQTQADEEMVFQPDSGYDIWLPAPLPERMPGIVFSPPASALRVTVSIRPKPPGQTPRKGQMYFSLENVTRHKGRCGNYPKNGVEKDDMRFAEAQEEGIVVDGPHDAHTREEVSEASIAIEATDTAAAGTLTARAPTLELKAIYKPTNTYALTIPRDDDGNRIADSWEHDMGLGSQHNVQADRDTVSGQDRAGDGLTVFDEYRGLVVLDNGVRTFKRFHPQKKEFFVVDPEGIFDSAVWFKASEILAYKVDESMIAGGVGAEASRIVNFNSDDSGHSKYAVRVKTIRSGDDPEGEEKGRLGLTPCGECRMPKDADYCAIVTDRIRNKVEQLYRDLLKALDDPGSKEGKVLADEGFPPGMPSQAAERLKSPQVRDSLARQMYTHLVIHEVGHACGLKDDHDTAPPSGKEQVVRSCPMYYTGTRAYMRFIVLQVLYGADASMSMQYREFCRGMSAYVGSGYNCFPRMNVADW